MGRIAGLKGMRHIALKVKNVAQSKNFYQEILGMDVVWEPDAAKRVSFFRLRQYCAP